MGHSPRPLALRTFGLAFAIALSPALMQTSVTCDTSTDLELLELWVPQYGAEDQIASFHPNTVAYRVELPRLEDAAVLRVKALEPQAEVVVEYDSVAVPLIWGELAAIEVPRGLSKLVVTVTESGRFKTYSVAIDRGTIAPQVAEQFVDDYVDERLEAGGAGLAITVMGADGVEFEKSYGMANIAQSIPIGSRTPFELASLSKQFTATAAMILYERGDLHPDDLVMDTFPEGRSEWATMTVHHLLTHQSGLSDHLNDQAPTGVFTGWTNEEVLAYVLETPLEFEPGERYEYSNSGYVMLALIVEQAAGQPFEEFVQEQIFAPLAMADSLISEQRPLDLPNRAVGYLQSVPFEALLRSMGDTGQNSSLEDLRQWELGLRDAALLSEGTYDLMFTQHAPRTNPECGYGYGWVRCDFEGYYTQLSHTGRLLTISTHIMRIPEEDLTVIMLSNGNLFSWIYNLSGAVRDLYLGYEPFVATKALGSAPCMYEPTASPIVTPRGVDWECE